MSQQLKQVRGELKFWQDVASSLAGVYVEAAVSVRNLLIENGRLSRLVVDLAPATTKWRQVQVMLSANDARSRELALALEACGIRSDD